ncbi:MAG: DnaB-like helicase N-terminal domain-containing protein, partial [Oscillospiraceae bacterium]
YAKEVIIAYDSDGAGQTATHKAVRLLDDVGVNTRVLKMEGAKDPDEFIKKFGAVRFKLLMDNSDSATAFEIEKCKANLDLETDSGKIEFLKRVVKVLAEVYQPIEREIYILKIANEFSIAKEVIKIQVDGIIRKRTKIVKEKQWEEIRSGANYSDKVNPEASLFKKEAKAETGILYFIFSHPEQFENIRKRLSPENFVTSFNKKIYSVISEKAKTSQDFTISSLGSEFTADEMGKISEILARFREILVTEQEIDDYIDVLLTHKDKAVQKTELTNDELLSLQAKLKNKKI